MDLLRLELAFEELESDLVKEMYRYWTSKRGDNLYPLMRNIELDDLPHVKLCSTIIDLHHPPFRMFTRFMGEQIIRFYGRDISGQWLDEVLKGEILEDYEISFRMAATSSEPLLAKSKWYGVNEVTNKTYEWGMFPVSENGVVVTSVIMIEDFSHFDKNELPAFLDSQHPSS